METKIRDLREDKDVKQQEICNYLNITQGQYSRIEKGDYQLDYQKLIKLAFFYNTSIDYLLGITNEFKPYPRANNNIKK